MKRSHPLPSADFAKRKLPIKGFPGPWFRIHRTKRGAIFFAREGTNRFDSPTHTFGVLYMARLERGAFIETFGHETGVRVFDPIELSQRALSQINTSRELRLVDLCGAGLARIGADGEILAGRPYDLPQAWAAAIHDHPSSPDGIAYRACHDPNQICAAIFDRAKGALSSTLLGAFDDRAMAPLLAKLLEHYDFGIAP